MRFARGKVVGNTIVFEKDAMPTEVQQGSDVTVFFDEAGWELDEASWRELDEARAAIRRGESSTDAQLDVVLDAAE
jgi:hypothetical protein